MDKHDIKDYFVNLLETETDVSCGMAAIRTLYKVLEKDQSKTVQELDANLQVASDVLMSTDYPITAVVSSCALFKRFITLAQLDTKTFDECREIMLHRGQVFLKKLTESRGKIAKHGASFIFDGKKILTHSKSRVVLMAFLEAAKTTIFEVFVTTSAPDNSGVEMVRSLREAGIQTTLVMDSAIGYIMEQVDLVMIGAEGVMESGGIINKIGTYTIGICAQRLHKPFYVLAESFKFVRVFPLNNRDIPEEFKYPYSKLRQDLSQEDPLVDYTPPEYISLLFTDLGILTPSAVSDELIKLYL